MEKCRFQNALVVGKKESKIYEVVKMLAGHFATVTRIENLDDLIQSYSSDHFGLIILTDSLNRKANENLFGRLRRFFPRAKLIGLFDSLNKELEISMRNVGMIYLGSYAHFKKNYPAILLAAFLRVAEQHPNKELLK